MATKKKVLKVPPKVTLKTTARQQSVKDRVRTDAEQTELRAFGNPAGTDSLDDVQSLKSQTVTVDKFVQDLRRDIDKGYLEPVDASEDTEFYDTIDDNTDLEFEQPTDTANGQLFTGRPFYRNIFRDPKRLEDKTWNAWETFSAISGMSVNELVRKADVGDLVLDRRSLSRLQSKYNNFHNIIKTMKRFL